MAIVSQRLPVPQFKTETWADLPPSIVERLKHEGVHCLADWRELGPKRFHIFGITRSVAQQLDNLARVVT